MHVQGNDREILGLHSIPQRHKGKPIEGTGHNGVRATEDDERSAKLEWKNCSPKQVHLQSNGKIAALSKFISKATEKCLPFFRTLRKSFEWTDKCQKAFEDLKKYRSSPPLLNPSKPGEELYLYIAVSQAAVSAALVREKEEAQQPVYFISRAF